MALPDHCPIREGRERRRELEEEKVATISMNGGYAINTDAGYNFNVIKKVEKNHELYKIYFNGMFIIYLLYF